MEIIKEWIKGGTLAGRFYCVSGRYFIDYHGCYETMEVVSGNGWDKEVPPTYVRYIKKWWKGKYGNMLI